MRRAKTRAFTVIEMLVVAGIMAILAGLSVATIKRTSQKAPAQGLVQVLAEELRLARQKAVTNASPVAVCLPADGIPQSSSFYILEGRNAPIITRVRDLSGDFIGASMFVGVWPGAPATKNAPLPAGSKAGAWDLDQWLPAGSKTDFVFCFTPDGSLITNDLPSFDGSYHIVAANGLTFGPGAAAGASTVSPGPVYAQLQQAGDPQTLSISPAGGITIRAGVVRGPGIDIAGRATGGAVAPRESVTTLAPSSVELSTIYVQSAPDPSIPNDGLCKPGQYISLECWARDPGGRQLFAKWNQTSSSGRLGRFSFPNGGAPPGSVLQKEVDRMEWDPNHDWGDGTRGGWRARWGWTVPSDAVSGDVFTVTADVRDARGEANIAVPPSLTLRVSPPGDLLFERDIGGARWQIYEMNTDGTNMFRLSPMDREETFPSVASDGRRMVCLSRDMATPGAPYEVYAMNVDGTMRRQITNMGGLKTALTISPSGEYVALVVDGDLWMARINGTDYPLSLGNPFLYRVAQNLANQPSQHGIKKMRPCWSPDSRWCLYEANSELRAVRFDGTDDTHIMGPFANGGVNEPPLSPSIALNGSRMAYSIGNYNPVISSIPYPAGGDPRGIVDPGWGQFIQMDGIAGIPSGSAGIDDDWPAVSPDGQRLLITRSTQTTSPPGTEDPGPFSITIVDYNVPNAQYFGPGSQITPAGMNARRAVWIK
ncbi:MAG: PD40 domain-containing protein [Candidatus Eremiobacteraeota bacterium]|nr:PD40 domain-containing protein [Candidatus Eremiobacteraeota bacterium]